MDCVGLVCVLSLVDGIVGEKEITSPWGGAFAGRDLQCPQVRSELRGHKSRGASSQQTPPAAVNYQDDDPLSFYPALTLTHTPELYHEATQV